METSKTFSSVETLDEAYQKAFKNCDELLPTLPHTKGWWFGQLFQYHGFWIPGEGHEMVNPLADLAASLYIFCKVTYDHLEVCGAGWVFNTLIGM
ncbi:hypothetical protein V6Z12_D03G045500 [Gossypium hirsutum]